MSNQTAKTEQRAFESAERLEKAKAKLLDGTIGAISVDTCIFTENGDRLDSGLLKHLEQFKDNAFQLVFSEITLREVHGHIAKNSEEAKTKLVSALRSAGKLWDVPKEKQELAVTHLLGEDSAKVMASNRVKDFASRCGAQVIDAKSMLDVQDLLKRYFSVLPPFEASAEKKSEFPDAIALLSLQAWAKKEGTALLFVTKDKGCKEFCKESAYLYAVDELGEALTIIQDRDTHCATLCKAIEAMIANGDYPDLVEKITDTVANHIWDISWIIEADAAFYYEDELDEVEVVSCDFASSHGRPEFSAVDYRNDRMVVQTSMKLDVRASCNFSFSVKDGIDHDMVRIGDALVSRKDTITVDVLLTFESPNVETPEVVEIELISSRQRLDFGSIEPDYGEENPDSEYY